MYTGAMIGGCLVVANEDIRNSQTSLVEGFGLSQAGAADCIRRREAKTV